jgi:hypothetical protein
MGESKADVSRSRYKIQKYLTLYGSWPYHLQQKLCLYDNHLEVVQHQNTDCLTSGSPTVFICSQLRLPAMILIGVLAFTISDWIHIFLPICLV